MARAITHKPDARLLAAAMLAAMPMAGLLARPDVIEPSAYLALSAITHCGLVRLLAARVQSGVIVALAVTCAGLAQAALGGAALEWGVGAAAALLAQLAAPVGASRVRVLLAGAILAAAAIVVAEAFWILAIVAGSALTATLFARDESRNRDIALAALIVAGAAQWGADMAVPAAIAVCAGALWLPRGIILAFGAFVVAAFTLLLSGQMAAVLPAAAFAGLLAVGVRLWDTAAHRIEALLSDPQIASAFGGKLAILRLDVARRVAVPLGGGGTIPFDRLFTAADPRAVLDLLDPARQADWSAQDWHPMTLSYAGGVHRWQVRLLGDRNGPILVAVDAGSEDALLARAEKAESLFAQTRPHEERLLALASHELRTPVSQLDMLLEEAASGSDWTTLQPQIDLSMRRLRAVLDELGMASGDMQNVAVRQTFTLREVVGALKDKHAAAAAGSGLRIVAELGDDADDALKGDYGRVLLALSRVVENAVRHSGGGKLVIQAFVAGPEAVWHLSDDGAGIPADRRDVIFAPFAGGLYTARQLARLAGGDLVLESGDGARFALRHPVRRAA